MFKASPRIRLIVSGEVAALAAMVVGSLTLSGGAAVSMPTHPTPGLKKPAVIAAVPAPPPLPPAPPALQARLEAIASAYGEKVGIAVTDVSDRWIAQVNGNDSLPQQSVSKTWVTISTLDAVDRGEISLDTPILVQKSDRSVFSRRPMGKVIPEAGMTMTVQEIIGHALIESDNTANDILIHRLGLDTVRQTLERKNLAGIQVGADERHLQAMIAGMTWDQSMAEGGKFKVVRAQLSDADRAAALDRYLAAPADGASPVGIVNGLARLKRGELLSPASTSFMFGVLDTVRTGRNRLKAGLKPGWSIAHKTGTGQDFDGASVGINDVGVLTAPDGHAYAVAVMIPHAYQPEGKRYQVMQRVSAAVADAWEEAGGKAPPAAAKPQAEKGKPAAKTKIVAKAKKK